MLEKKFSVAALEVEAYQKRAEATYPQSATPARLPAQSGITTSHHDGKGQANSDRLVGVALKANVYYVSFI